MRCLLFLLYLYAASGLTAPRIVTSAPPVNDLAAALAAGVTTPQAIVEGHASLHHFALRPSHMRKLEQADLVIWIDRHFESGFNRLPEILPQSVKQLELMPLFDSQLADGHFWFSPGLLLVGVDRISATLIEIDPDNKDSYRANAADLREAILAWREQMRERWRTRPPRVITDHAFLGALAREFELEQVLALHDHHDDGGGLGELRRLEQKMQQTQFHCLATLEVRTSALGNSLAEKYGLRIIQITGGADTDSPKPPILQRLDQLARALDQCR